jgi:hypothetical protein
MTLRRGFSAEQDAETASASLLTIQLAAHSVRRDRKRPPAFWRAPSPWKRSLPLPRGRLSTPLRSRHVRQFAPKRAETDGRKQAVTLSSLEPRTQYRFVATLLMTSREVPTDELLYSTDVASVIDVRDGLITRHQTFPSRDGADVAYDDERSGSTARTLPLRGLRAELWAMFCAGPGDKCLAACRFA